MPEMLIVDRIVFKNEGQQRNFLYKSKESVGCTWAEFAEILKINIRTLSDWKREKFRMSYDSALFLSKKSGINLPAGFKKQSFIEHLKRAGIKGGLARIGVDGKLKIDEEKRRNKWKEWWENEGKYNQKVIGKKKSFCVPRVSSKLAEFVGIILGDGGISNYQVTVTLNKIDDKEYGKFVSDLVHNLFNVQVGEYTNKKDLGVNFVISRVDVVDFCTKKLGLKKGNKVKNQVDVPSWIKCNNNFSMACVRGLIDTDGCLVIHKYKVGGKMYKYKKLAFTSMSVPLVNFVHHTLKSNEIKSRIYKNKDVWVDSKKGVETYVRIFNSNNPKHLMRYAK